jgi:hypothetical protein
VESLIIGTGGAMIVIGVLAVTLPAGRRAVQAARTASA